MKTSEFALRRVEFIPNTMEDGVLYYSEQFELAIHRCACGCGVQTVTPIGTNGWQLTISDERPTLNPSIGNFNGETPYHAHYFIRNGIVQWC
jgi:hypothetical protein